MEEAVRVALAKQAKPKYKGLQGNFKMRFGPGVIPEGNVTLETKQPLFAKEIASSVCVTCRISACTCESGKA